MDERTLIGLLPLSGNRHEIIAREGYKIKEENGKFYLSNDMDRYPKTYAECCQVLGVQRNLYLQLSCQAEGESVDEQSYGYKLSTGLNALYRLLVCRDAYWKLAGDWKPDWTSNDFKSIIYFKEGEAILEDYILVSHPLAFRTSPERDLFYENFKDLIEECKELL